MIEKSIFRVYMYTSKFRPIRFSYFAMSAPLKSLNLRELVDQSLYYSNITFMFTFLFL